MIKRTRAAIAVSATLAAVAASFAIASPASAIPEPCGPSGSDPNAKCAYVINVNPGSHLNVRSGPGRGFDDVGDLFNGDRVEVECWTRGESVNGYNIWTQLYSAGRARYVSDWYLSTGRVQDHLRQC